MKFADFFNEHGTKALAVNEYFDSELGAHVSERSLHGQLITKHFGGNSAAFNLAVGDALSTEEGVHVERASGNQTKFPIGTTVSLPVNTDSYILVAMCKTDLKTLKAQADLSTYMAALEGLWEKARATHNGRPVIVPLIGTGLAGIGLPASKMLDLLLLSFVEANKSLEVCQQLVVVLDSNKFADFDLSRTLAAWS